MLLINTKEIILYLFCYVCQNYVFYLSDIFMSCTIPCFFLWVFFFFSFDINLVSSAYTGSFVMKYLINRCITKWIHTVNIFVNLLIEFVKLNFNHGYPKINLEIDYDSMV